MSNYVIVDLEMCKVPVGIRRNFRSAYEIIEIGAVMLDDEYKVCDRFKSYVSPEYGEIDSFIQNLTGITAEQTKNAPSLKEALEKFAEWMPEDAIPVSWSINDERQIRKELKLKNIQLESIEMYLERWEDCQKTFSDKMESPKIYKLSEALIIADIDYDENIHDGLVDAENTAMLFAKMKKEKKLKLSSYYATEEEKSSTYTPFAILLKNAGYIA